MGDVSEPFIDVPLALISGSRMCGGGKAFSDQNKGADMTVADARTPPLARCRQSHLWDAPAYLQDQRTMTKAAADEESEGHPMPWRPAEKPYAEGGTS